MERLFRFRIQISLDQEVGTAYISYVLLPGRVSRKLDKRSVCVFRLVFIIRYHTVLESVQRKRHWRDIYGIVYSELR
jgi:hypothetical protein